MIGEQAEFGSLVLSELLHLAGQREAEAFGPFHLSIEVGTRPRKLFTGKLRATLPGAANTVARHSFTPGQKVVQRQPEADRD